jgi:predicted RNase H-like HicB family nuclease
MIAKFYPAIVFYSNEDQGFIAKSIDLKGCSAFGETPEQALKELETAVELWLEVAEKDHSEIPEPSQMAAFG